MSNQINNRHFELGLKICDSGIKLQNQLVDMLKIMNKSLKSVSSKGHFDQASIDKVNGFTKTILMALMLADEQLNKGIELCKNNDSIQ